MARVLLVDDDIAEISAVKRVLARGGHQPVLATNAAEALAAVARAAPELLVVAASCEGGEALRRLGTPGAAPGVPLVVLGEAPSPAAGAYEVPRPIDPSTLAERVAAALAATPPAAVEAAASPGPAAPREAAAPPRSAPAAPRAAPGVRPAPRSAPAARPARPRTAAVPPPEARRAAAEALRARAEELRRASPPAGAAPAPPPVEEDPGLEALLRRAEEAERAEAEARAARARERANAEERARDERERRARAAERERAEEARRAAAARRAAEERARVEAERARAAAEAAARAQEEDLRAGEERREAERRAEDEAEAAERERAFLEEEARRRLERELAELHAEVEADRLAGLAAPVEARAATPARAAVAAAADPDEEDALRAAIASARAEMEVLRRRTEEEARRRAEAEAAVARLEEEARRSPAAPAPDAAADDLLAPIFRPPAVDPRPDPAEEAARRRAAAARERDRAGGGGLRPSPRDGAPPGQAPLPPELRAGALADLPAPRLLALAARSAVTGRLDVEGTAARTLWLEAGRVVGASSAAPGERVEELALRLGLVTRDQHRQVAAAAATLSARRCALLLVERGFLKPGELTALVRRRTEEVAFGIFAEEAARFRLTGEGAVPPEERIQLDRSTLALAVEGVRRRWLAPRVDAVLGGPGTLLAPVTAGPAPDELGLSEAERRALSLADGLRTVEEVVLASPLDGLSTRQVLAALVAVGSLAVRVFEHGRPAAVAAAAIDLARVWEKLEQARRADYFTVLGVGRLCTPHEVREAAERLSTELDPARFQGVHEEGLEARLEEILGVVADAREILVDDRLRAEYLRGLGG